MRRLSAIMSVGLTFIGCSAAPTSNALIFPTAFPFAEGPSQSASKLVEAIARCRAPAKVFDDGVKATVMLDLIHNDKVERCLMAWLDEHPESGFVRMGFVGSENPQRP
jgi:hypothetical protein